MRVATPPLKLNIAAIHGVAHGAEDKRLFAKRWEEALMDAGLPVRVSPITWNATESFVGDVWRMISDQAHRDACKSEVAKRVRLWEKQTVGPKVILAHSMGTVLVPEETNTRVIAIGTPLTHPIFGPALRFDRQDVGVALVNRDDGISALARRWIREQDAYKVHEVVIIDEEKRWPREHDDLRYLEHAALHNLLRKCYAPRD